MNTEIIEFHDTDLYCPVVEDQIYVAIKPICQALDIDHSWQLQRLKKDPILGSTVGTVPTVGRDDKAREMVCLLYQYIFGWLFRIDANQVKQSSREQIMAYQRECYDVLFHYFFGKTDRYKKRD